MVSCARPGAYSLLLTDLYQITMAYGYTHAHSWVMAFDSEEEAFSRYAGRMPKNCVFLVDTYDTIEGVRNAVRVARGLREKGQEMVGIRLDSGDLACLSIKAEDSGRRGLSRRANLRQQRPRRACHPTTEDRRCQNRHLGCRNSSRYCI